MKYRATATQQIVYTAIIEAESAEKVEELILSINAEEIGFYEYKPPQFNIEALEE